MSDFEFRINPDEKEPVVEELTINEIINGGKGFPGLIPFMHRFLQDTATEIETSCKVKVFHSSANQNAAYQDCLSGFLGLS